MPNQSQRAITQHRSTVDHKREPRQRRAFTDSGQAHVVIESRNSSPHLSSHSSQQHIPSSPQQPIRSHNTIRRERLRRSRQRVESLSENQEMPQNASYDARPERRPRPPHPYLSQRAARRLRVLAHLEVYTFDLHSNNPLPSSGENSLKLDRYFPDVEVPFDIRCNITHDIVTDPVFDVRSPKQVFERAQILHWISIHQSHPITKQELTVEFLRDDLVTKAKSENFILNLFLQKVLKDEPETRQQILTEESEECFDILLLYGSFKKSQQQSERVAQQITESATHDDLKTKFITP